MSLIAIVFSAFVGGVLNRFSGYKNLEWLPGRNVYWASLAIFMLAWYGVGFTFAAVLFLSTVLYRVPGWYQSIDMGKNEGTLQRDAGVMYIRTLMMFPIFMYAAMYLDKPHAIPVLIVSAVGAVLSYISGNYVVSKWMKDPFWFVEFAAGACLGAAVGTLV